MPEQYPQKQTREAMELADEVLQADPQFRYAYETNPVVNQSLKPWVRGYQPLEPCLRAAVIAMAKDARLPDEAINPQPGDLITIAGARRVLALPPYAVLTMTANGVSQIERIVTFKTHEEMTAYLDTLPSITKEGG